MTVNGGQHALSLYICLSSEQWEPNGDRKLSNLIESVLSRSQRESLKINKFIFHIIDPSIVENDEGVVYLDEIELSHNQKNFFLDRLRDIAEGTQYIFNENTPFLKEKCFEMQNNDCDFIKTSRSITADFANRHSGSMSAGIFAVALVEYLKSANDWQKLVLLLKIDKSASFSYSYHEKEDGKRVASLHEVENALVESKAAIQKSAVIDISNSFLWNVLAFDRVHRPYLADYYKAFLGVIERQQDSFLTKKVHATVRDWASRLKLSQMPKGEDMHSYIGRSFNYLSDHDIFDTDAFLNTVVRDKNANNKAILIDSLRKELEARGFAGQSFTPKPNSLPARLRRQIYETAEGLIISFQGSKEANGLKEESLRNGKKLVTIETASLIPKN